MTVSLSKEGAETIAAIIRDALSLRTTDGRDFGQAEVLFAAGYKHLNGTVKATRDDGLVVVVTFNSYDTKGTS